MAIASLASQDAFPIGFGLMGFSVYPNPKFTQEQFDETLVAAFKQAGNKRLYVNSAEFYGDPDRHEGLKKIAQFFTKYPEYADQVILAIKGGTGDNWVPTITHEFVPKVIDTINQFLEPVFAARKTQPKHLDYFTLSRFGSGTVEEVASILNKQRENKTVGKIAISEITGPTLEALSKLTQIDQVEVEYSLFSRNPETDGLMKVAGELGIPLVAYSPLGKGLLVGVTKNDVGAGDFRGYLDRFQDDHYAKNKPIIDAVFELAKKKGAQPSQIALGWVLSRSNATINGVKFPEILPIPGTTKAYRVPETLKPLELTKEDLAEINNVLEQNKVSGYRYNADWDSLER